MYVPECRGQMVVDFWIAKAIVARVSAGADSNHRYTRTQTRSTSHNLDYVNQQHLIINFENYSPMQCQ